MSSTSNSHNAQTLQIITSGKPYLDIDAYGAIIAYAELLQTQGLDAQAVSSSILNESIPPQLRKLKVGFHTSLKPSSGHDFTVLDTSDPGHFDSLVELDQVTEVIDHHPGHEAYWAARPRVKTHIELLAQSAQ